MKRRLKLNQGISLPISVLFFVVTAGITVGATTLADNGHRMAVAATHKQQADSLAESAVYALYDKIWRQLRSDGTYPTVLPSTTLNSSIDGVSREMGSYSATVVSVTKNTTDIGDGMTQEDFTFTILGYGKAKNGTDSEINATFSGSQVRMTSGSGVSKVAFLPAVIQSNTSVDVISDAGFKMVAPTAAPQTAHLFANQDIDWTRTDGSRIGTGNTKLSIDGKVMVSKTADTAYYDFTRARFNDYKSQGILSSIGDARLSVTSNDVVPSAQRVFPSQAQVDTWTTTWEQDIRANSISTILNVSAGADTVSNGQSGLVTITAPAYIDGDLVVNADSVLQLMPLDPDPAKNIVMVTGDVKNLGEIQNYGVTLYCIGKYTDTPTSKYKVAADLQHPIGASMNNAALVSASVASDAISISSDQSMPYGLVYAAKGGLTITGNGLIAGALVSGSSVPGEGVTIKPTKGGQFTMNYLPECLTNKLAFPISSTSMTSNIIVEFLPTKLTGWTKARAAGTPATS
jgi:hypothetical protein